MEDEHIYKSRNKNLLLYHLVFSSKYRRKIFSSEVEKTLKNICVGISERYEVKFVEIGVYEGSCSLPCPKCADDVYYPVTEGDKEFDRKKAVLVASGNKGTVVVRSSMDRWLLCKYGRTICKPRCYPTVRCW